MKLPENIYLIAGLRSLTLHANQLRELPRSIGELEILERFDVRSNRLTYLPTTLAQLKTKACKSFPSKRSLLFFFSSAAPCPSPDACCSRSQRARGTAGRSS